MKKVHLYNAVVSLTTALLRCSFETVCTLCLRRCGVIFQETVCFFYQSASLHLHNTEQINFKLKHTEEQCH